MEKLKSLFMSKPKFWIAVGVIVVIAIVVNLAK